MGRNALDQVTPQMLDSWGKFITKVGAWVVLGGYLVVQLTGEVKSNTRDALQVLRGHEQTTHQLVATQSVIAETVRRQANISAQQCVNLSAGDDAKIDRCFAALNGETPSKPSKP